MFWNIAWIHQSSSLMFCEIMLKKTGWADVADFVWPDMPLSA